MSLEETKKIDKDQFYTYYNNQGFEVRKGFVRNYNYSAEYDPRQSEIRIRHNDHEVIELLYEKIKEWLET